MGSHSALQLGLSVDSFLSLDQLAVGVLSRDLDLNDGGLALAVAEVVAAVSAGPVLDVAGLGAGGVLGLNIGQAAGMAAVGVLVLRFGISLALGVGHHRGTLVHEDGGGGVKADDLGIGFMAGDVTIINGSQTSAADHGTAADIGIRALDVNGILCCTLGIGTDGTAGHGKAAQTTYVLHHGAVYEQGGSIGILSGGTVDIAVDIAAGDENIGVINKHHTAAQGSGIAGNDTAVDGNGLRYSTGSGRKSTAVSSRVAADRATVHGELGTGVHADGTAAVGGTGAVAADLTAVHNEFGRGGLIRFEHKADSDTALAACVQGVVDDLAVLQSHLAGHMDQGVAGSNPLDAGDGAVFAAVLNGELSAVGHVDVGEGGTGQGVAVQVEGQGVAYGQRVSQTHVIGQGDGAVLSGGKQGLGRHHSRGGHEGGGDHVPVGVGHHNEGLSLLDVGAVHSQGVQSIARLRSNGDGDGGAGNARGGIDGHSAALADGGDGDGVGVADGPGIVSIGVVLTRNLTVDHIVSFRLLRKPAAGDGEGISAGAACGDRANLTAGHIEVSVSGGSGSSGDGADGAVRNINVMHHTGRSFGISVVGKTGDVELSACITGNFNAGEIGRRFADHADTRAVIIDDLATGELSYIA